jgi:protein phosphatase
MVEAGELTEDAAAVHPYRSVITRAIGIERSIEVDSISQSLRPGDRVLLCTDGLTNMVPDGGIAEILATTDDPREAATALTEAANQAGGVDNTTVVVVDVRRDQAD